MNDYAILYPSFALVFLTLGIGIWMRKLRGRACTEGLNPQYFKLNKGGKQPDYLLKVTQHYDNLFEMPTLFYVLTIMIYITQQTDMVLLILAWLYVVGRYAHAFVHTTYNNLWHRQIAFLLSTSVMGVMWGWLLVRLLGG